MLRDVDCVGTLVEEIYCYDSQIEYSIVCWIDSIVPYLSLREVCIDGD